MLWVGRRDRRRSRAAGEAGSSRGARAGRILPVPPTAKRSRPERGVHAAPTRASRQRMAAPERPADEAGQSTGADLNKKGRPTGSGAGTAIPLFFVLFVAFGSVSQKANEGNENSRESQRETEGQPYLKSSTLMSAWYW